MPGIFFGLASIVTACWFRKSDRCYDIFRKQIYICIAFSSAVFIIGTAFPLSVTPSDPFPLPDTLTGLGFVYHYDPSTTLLVGSFLTPTNCEPFDVETSPSLEVLFCVAP